MHKRDTNTLRIISGKWRSRLIKFPDIEGLRPTTDRRRETIFNWLQQDIINTICLDLFTGSGVLGIEALSRGAKDVIFVDSSPIITNNLKQIANTLGTQFKTYCTLALDFCSNYKGEAFDLIFLDPPFKSELLNNTILELASNNYVLKAGTLLYIESASSQEIKLPSNWQCIKQKQEKAVNYGLFLVENKL